MRTLKSTPTFIFIKTVFDVEKCLASRQGLSRHTHFLLSEYCSFKKIYKLFQSLFKTSPVTWRPSLKRLSGIQEQLLSLCMGKHQILQNCSLSLQLNFIFEITNEIGQQLCHKCCFFCSNSVIKSLFLRLDQPVRMRSPFYSNRDF